MAGQEAPASAAGRDLALMDMQMPGMDRRLVPKLPRARDAACRTAPAGR